MRKALTLAFAALFVVGMSAWAVADEHPGPASGIEGTWLSVVYAGGEPLMQFLHTFNADGRTTLVLPFGPDAIIPGGPSEPTVNLGDSRVACTGEWRHVRNRTFDVTMYCLWRQNPGVTPDRIRYRLTLDKSGTSLSGPFKYLYMDPVLGAPGFEGEYALKSARLGIVPLD